MNKIKATLNMVPKTHDEDYEQRKSALKELNDGMHAYKAAMSKVQSAMRSAMDSLGAVSKAFEKLTADVTTDSGNRDVAEAFTTAYNRINGDSYAEFTNTMNSDVVCGLNELKRLYDECSKIETDRNKMRAEYDVYRNEVSTKEAEYEKKGKDLSTSKGYSSSVAKRDDYRSRYEAENEKHKETHDKLVSMQASSVLNSMDMYFSCSLRFVRDLSNEFDSLRNAAEHQKR